MRVADTVTTATVMNNVQRSNYRLSRHQRALSSGTRINDPSDDPFGASRALLLRSDIRNLEQVQRNIDESLGYTNFVDSGLDDMVNALINMRGIAVQGASDTVNAGDRVILSREVDEMLEHMVSLSQTKFRGRYVFAGAESLERPYTPVRDADGNITSVGNSLRRSVPVGDTTTAVGTLLQLGTPPSGTVTIGDQTVAIDLATDSLDTIKANIEAAAPTGVTVDIERTDSRGNSFFRLKIDGTTTAVDSNNVLGTMGIGSVDTTGAITREIDDGVQIQVNIPGRDLFEGAQNAFTALMNLRNGLQSNDMDAIRQSITDIETVREKISDERGVLGARTRRVELTRDLLDRFEVNLSTSLGDIEDADLTETIIDLQTEQQSYQAALTTGSTMFQPTLIDFLQ